MTSTKSSARPSVRASSTRAESASDGHAPGQSAAAPTIDVGRKAPAFALRDQTGELRRLKVFLGRPVVLYFYPKDDTPGCTTEACGFRDIWQELERNSAVVLGVSPDPVESHEAFARKFELPFLLLADRLARDGVPKVCTKYGVWQPKTMYGRTSMGVVRTTYLIDEAGKVAKRWDRVKAAGHADEVLAAVRQIRPPMPPNFRA